MILKNVLFLAFFFLITGIGLAGQYQTTDEEEQRLIKKAEYFQTIDDYQDYLNHYPDGVYSEKARIGTSVKIEEIKRRKGETGEEIKELFDEVISSKQLYKCIVFIERFPDSSYAGKVRVLYDGLLWENIKKTNTVSSYKSYLLYSSKEDSVAGHVIDAESYLNKIYIKRNGITREKIERIESRAKMIPKGDYKENIKVYTTLLKLDPTNSLYEEKATYYREKYISNARNNISKINDKGSWGVVLNINPIDDSTTVTLVLEATTGKSAWGHKITMVVRCKSNKTDMYINWGDYLGNEASVLTRIGSKDADIARWVMSTDSKTTFYPAGTISFLKAMFPYSKFVVQITPYNENPITAIFDIFGLENAIKPLRETCNW